MCPQVYNGTETRMAHCTSVAASSKFAITTTARGNYETLLR